MIAVTYFPEFGAWFLTRAVDDLTSERIAGPFADELAARLAAAGGK
jgi:hypothetical protein